MNNIKLNQHGVNSVIQAHLLSDEEMKAIGFSDIIKDKWCFFRIFDGFKPNRLFTHEVSFNVSISKSSPEDLKIDVLDEDFCQPYDYQHVLEKNPSCEPALKVQAFVEEWMEYLQNKGVLSGHVNGEYI